MLRALPDAEATARVLAKACAAVVPNEAAAVRAKDAPVRDHGLRGAAA